jgi:hypothetical protein
MEKNNIEIFEENEDEELTKFLDVIAKKGKLELFFKVLDVIVDDKISDDIEINMDDIIKTINDEEGLEKKDD